MAKKKYWMVVEVLGGKALQAALQEFSDRGVVIVTVTPGVTTRSADISFYIVAFEER